MTIDVKNPSAREVLNEILFDALTLEFGDTKATDMEEVMSWMEGLRQSGLPIFFSSAQILNLAFAASDSLPVRRFTQSVTERVLLAFTLTNIGQVGGLNDMLRDSIIENQSTKHAAASLIPKNVSAGMTIPRNELELLLDDNPWLTVIYLSLLTGAYRLAAQEYLRDDPRK